MKNIILSVLLGLFAISSINAQEKKEELKVDVKGGAAPDIYVDGKKFEFPMDLLDKNKIASVNMVKGEKAIKEYQAKNGVVLITTKASAKKITKLSFDEMGDKNPLVILDGKKSSRAALEKLTADDIESINVVKGEMAMKKYNAANGVIVVTTKKE